MPGERFSLLYVQPGDLLPDSVRARYRIGTLFGETIFNGHSEGLAAQIKRNLGIAIPGDGQHPPRWNQLIRECRTTDFLDTMTVVYRYLFWHVSEPAADWWRDAVRQIFNEEHLGYVIDDAGGLHPRVDREFQRNMASAVAGLESERYRKVRELIDIGTTNLSSDPPNYKQAWRATLSAIEVLFGTMFTYGRLTTDEIDRRLQPVVEQTYESDPTAQKAALMTLAGFKHWVDASQRYRHHPGAAEPPQPPADIAILSISHGASLLRWLAGLDQASLARSEAPGSDAIPHAV